MTRDKEEELLRDQVAGRVTTVRAKLTRSARLGEAVTVAPGHKYDTKASRKWVEGFGEPARGMATLELVPAEPDAARTLAAG